MKMILHQYDLDTEISQYLALLISFHEYSKCISFIKNISERSIKKLPISLLDEMALQNFHSLIFLDQYSDPDIPKLLQKLDHALLSTLNSNKFICLKCKYYLAIGEYEKIIDLTPPLYELCHLHPYESEIWRIGCIALKHLTTMKQCIKCLEMGLQSLPDDPLLNYTLWTHQSKISQGLLDQSIKYFKKCSDLYAYLSLEERLHNENNIAVCYFYNDDHEEAYKLVSNIQTESFINGITIEECRSWNTIAMIDWYKGDLLQAKNSFNTALKILENSYHATHLWPIYINLALLNYEENNTGQALYFCRKASNHLKKYYKKSLLQINKVDDIGTMPKYFIGLFFIACLNHLLNDESSNVMLNELVQKDIADVMIAHLEIKDMRNLFKNTLYIRNQHFMLKL